MAKASSRAAAGWRGEIMYVFKDVPVKCVFADGFPQRLRPDALRCAEIASREMLIDKTYVDFEGTKFKKTFLTEKGWNALQKLIKSTRYGKTASPAENAALGEAFRQMAAEYVRHVMRDAGWDVDLMEAYVEKDAAFVVEYWPDTAEEWRRYPGEWQTWEDGPQ